MKSSHNAITKAWETLRLEPWQFCALSLYTALISVLNFFHEPWRDEAQAWLMARDVESYAELFQYSGYEGSPMLWHTLLFPLAQLGLPMWSMAVLHGGLAILTIWVVLKFSPFTRLQTALLPFGYFFVYEYSVIPRSYVLTALLLFIVAALYKGRKQHVLWYGIALALLAQTNTFAVVSVIVLVCVELFEYARQKNWRGAKFLLLPATSVALAVWQLLPPPDLAENLVPWVYRLDIYRFLFSAKILREIFSPLELLHNYNWSVYRDFSWLLFCYGVLQVGLLAGYFARRSTTALLGAGLVGGNVLLLLGKNLQTHRHIGMVFLVLIVWFWIQRHEDTAEERKQSFFRWYGSIGLTVLLVLQVVAGAVAGYAEITQEFSAAQRAGQYVSTIAGDNTIVAGYPSSVASALVPHLNRGTFYSVEQQTERSFMVWNRELSDNYPLPAAEVIQRVEAYARKQSASEIVLLYGIDKSRELATDVEVYNQHGYVAEQFSGSLTEDFLVFRKTISLAKPPKSR